MAQIEAPTTDHPLDPLTEEEINLSTELLKEAKDLDDTFGFYSYQPIEPSKEDLEEWDEDGSIDREIIAVLRDFQTKETYEATISLTDKEIVSWKHVPDAQPHMPAEDILEAEDTVKQSEVLC